MERGLDHTFPSQRGQEDRRKLRKKLLLVQETDNSLLEWEIQLSTHGTECVFRLHYVCGELQCKHCIREVRDKAFLLFSNMILERKHKQNVETIKDDCV